MTADLKFAADLEVLSIPSVVEPNDTNRARGRALLAAWQSGGGFRVSLRLPEEAAIERALNAARAFFQEPDADKVRYVSDLSYSGHTPPGAPGEGGPSASEVFTVCPDVPADDPRVVRRWPCHGPVPWPSPSYKRAMRGYTRVAADLANRTLQLVALGLGLDMDALRRITDHGWHHLRATRTPVHHLTADTLAARDGSGLLVIEAHDAGAMPPRHLTVLPGDVLAYLTGGEITPIPVPMEATEHARHALAYYFAPGFQRVVRPLDPRAEPDDYMHFGTHRTGMFMRAHPGSPATARIEADRCLLTLARLRHQALRVVPTSRGY